MVHFWGKYLHFDNTVKFHLLKKEDFDVNLVKGNVVSFYNLEATIYLEMIMFYDFL